MEDSRRDQQIWDQPDLEQLTSSGTDSVFPPAAPEKPRLRIWVLALAAAAVIAVLAFVGRKEDAPDYLERRENFRNSPGYQQIVEDLKPKFDGIG